MLLRGKTFWETKLLRGAGEGDKEQRARREKERK